MSRLDEVKLGDRTKAAFEGARDTCKQILTLTTAILALTVSFKKDIISGRGSLWLISLSWTAFLLSVLFGIAALLSLTGSIDPKVVMDEETRAQPRDALGRSIYRPNIRVSFFLQLLLFVVGLAGFVIFGIVTI
jgi:hypothetical protein